MEEVIHLWAGLVGRSTGYYGSKKHWIGSPRDGHRYRIPMSQLTGVIKLGLVYLYQTYSAEFPCPDWDSLIMPWKILESLARRAERHSRLGLRNMDPPGEHNVDSEM